MEPMSHQGQVARLGMTSSLPALGISTSLINFQGAGKCPERNTGVIIAMTRRNAHSDSLRAAEPRLSGPAAFQGRSLETEVAV
ncbi:hypothetical protein J6590_042641 [Homalodisca vitripennis]|nr:hypothetical protein J6590_042641 [Homalodisca vitripennis]